MDPLTVEITNPFAIRILYDLVEAGRYRSIEEAVTDGVRLLSEQPEPEPLTEEDLVAIAEADAEFERGEGIEFSEVARRLREQLRSRFRGV
jgi:Arc/MetJ-type ribon-helix-helix transcriptional regulator